MSGASRSIYVIKSDRGSVKVGIASNARRRLYSLRVASPARLSLEYEGKCDTETVRQIEARAHELLGFARENGEWFAVDVDAAVRAVMESARELGYEIRRPDPPKPRRYTGRPATGKTPMVGVRLSAENRREIEDWAARQPDQPRLSEAIRRLLESALRKWK